MPSAPASAQEPTDGSVKGTCLVLDSARTIATTKSGCPKTYGAFTPYGPDNPEPGKEPADFEEEFGGGCATLLVGRLGECMLKITYTLFYTIPGWFTGVVAKFFNLIVSLSLDSGVYGADFLPQAWRIARDLSNIFFILILLYIAIKIILGLAGHDGKKMIIWVIIMALLINFSMFATKIVIDSSNVLALIFYNKIETRAIDSTTGKPTPYGQSHKGERDLAGGLFDKMDVTKLMTKEFVTALKNKTHDVELTKLGLTTAAGAGAGIGAAVGSFFFGLGAAPGFLLGGAIGGVGAAVKGLAGALVGTNDIPFGTKMAVIMVVGSILWYAIYAFFRAGLAFLSRLIELWMLIIFSPFAFMSFAMPALKKVKYIGWDEWLHKLLSVSFMAPIFMLFMYFIFMIAQTNLFDAVTLETLETRHPIETTVFILLPSLIILILLTKAVSYAKKGSQELLGGLTKGLKIAAGIGGFALGGAALGAAVAGRQTVGRFMKGASTGDTAAQRFTRGESRGRVDRLIGQALHGTPIDRAQQGVGGWLNRNQQERMVESAHARHELDSAANTVTHGIKSKWNDLNGRERELARIKIARDQAMRMSQGNVENPETGLALGTRNEWSKLTDPERERINEYIGVQHDPVHGDEIIRAPGERMHEGQMNDTTFVREAIVRQSLGGAVAQSTVSGSYDIRNLANVAAREGTSVATKALAGSIGALAMTMRGGLKQVKIDYGTAQNDFFKDIGNTVTQALSNAKINVDLSKVGEVKKESDKGHGGGH